MQQTWMFSGIRVFGWAVTLRCLCLVFVMACAFAVRAGAAPKTSVFVLLEDGPGWRDMAYLAAVPASEVANGSGGSLIALGPDAGLGPEFHDYLRRYKPKQVYLLGPAAGSSGESGFLSGGDAELRTLAAASAADAAIRLSLTFWKQSDRVVLCQEDDYESALVAAPLAALLKSPMLYVSASGVSQAVREEIKRLGAERVVSVGAVKPDGLGNALALSGAREVMKWVKEQGFDVSYLAAVNPMDRTTSKVRKLSMVGAQLAAGRRGLVVPLNHAVEWKKPFSSAEPEQELPAEFRNQKLPVRTGRLKAGAADVAYVLSGKPDDNDLALFLDRDGSGTFQGPVRTGDQIELDGRKWVVSLGKGSSYHDSDVHITWPTADVLNGQLLGYYGVLGLPPEHLCLVGLPDVIPQALYRGISLSSDVASDLPYAMGDESNASRIAVGRVVAEDVRFGTLYAARVLTYRDLLDPEWTGKASQAEWENSFGPLFESAGFDASYWLKDEDIPWVEPPSEGNKGKRALSFAQDSPLARSHLLAHMNHSWNFELGKMFKWDATVLMAPTVMESGGCGTTCLDRRAPGQAIVEGASGAQSPELATRHRSVVSRLFRLGVVSFAGGSREMMAENLPFRQEFWNGVLAGETVGKAHLRAQNTGHMILKGMPKDQKENGYHHSLQAHTLLGDPAVSIPLPEKRRATPARTEWKGDRVTVHAPGKWTSVKLFVPPDWKKWAKRDLFVVRAPGAYSLSTWGPEERDVEIPMVKAEFRSDRKIKDLALVGAPGPSLGWSGVWHSNRNRDGGYTHRFGVRMIDFDQEKGNILHSVDRLEFSVVFE